MRQSVIRFALKPQLALEAGSSAACYQLSQRSGHIYGGGSPGSLLTKQNLSSRVVCPVTLKLLHRGARLLFVAITPHCVLINEQQSGHFKKMGFPKPRLLSPCGRVEDLWKEKKGSCVSIIPHSLCARPRIVNTEEILTRESHKLPHFQSFFLCIPLILTFQQGRFEAIPVLCSPSKRSTLILPIYTHTCNGISIQIECVEDGSVVGDGLPPISLLPICPSTIAHPITSGVQRPSKRWVEK